MTREEKHELVKELTEKLSETENFYIADASGFTVAQINDFRRMCFEKGVEYQVVKNSLIKKALANLDTEADYTEFDEEVLRGFSGIMFSETGNTPAKIIKEYRKENGTEQPFFKGASIDAALYIGEDKLETLSNIKSREELIGDVIMLLQSPARRLVGAFTSGGGRLAGMVKGIAEKGE